MNSEVAFNHLEGLAKGGSLKRLSPNNRSTKAIVYTTLTGWNLALEVGDTISGHYAKTSTIVLERDPPGANLNWQAISQLVGVQLSEEQFKSSAYKAKGARLGPGQQRHFKIESLQALDALLNAYSTGLPDSDRMSRAAVEAAMDECDRLGESSFLEARQFGKPCDYRVRRSDGQTYPAKAVAGVAFGYLPSGEARTGKTINGGYSGPQSACSLLEALNYEIVDINTVTTSGLK